MDPVKHHAANNVLRGVRIVLQKQEGLAFKFKSPSSGIPNLVRNPDSNQLYIKKKTF
jgi:hypothetical protein